MKKICTTAILAFLCIACSGQQNNSPFPTISDEAKAGLNRPVNCRTASQDIQTLEEERASVAKQILSGVRSVFPIAAVVGLITGDYHDRFQVATGDYNNAIEIKIDQIQKACGIPAKGNS